MEGCGDSIGRAGHGRPGAAGSAGLLLLALAALAALGQMACSTQPAIFLPEPVAAIDTVALVYFTVPATITSRDQRDPHGGGDPSIRATGPNGARAATAAHYAFLESIDRARLPFELLTHAQVVGNGDFRAMPRPEPPPDPMARASGVMESISAAFTPRWGDGRIREGAAPEHLSEFGLRDWETLFTDSRERAYVKRSLQVLNAAGALLIVDRGFRFNCAFCVAVFGASSNGEATTASGAIFALVNRAGEIVAKGRLGFTETPTTARASLGLLERDGEDRLFEAHGRAMATAFVAAWAALAAHPPPAPEP